MFKNLKSLYFQLSPFVIYLIHGRSMEPEFKINSLVILQKKWFFCGIKKNDVIVLSDPRNGSNLLKRITKIKNYHYFVTGDNSTESTDSRIFGWISSKEIIGKVIFINR